MTEKQGVLFLVTAGPTKLSVENRLYITPLFQFTYVDLHLKQHGDLKLLEICISNEQSLVPIATANR